MTRPRALVVDDSPSNRKLVSKLIGKEFSVDEAGRAEEAQERMAAVPPDVLIVDLGLPGVPGLEFISRLKADPRTRGIPVVVVTAYAMPGDEARSRSAGCADFITKPIDTRTFADRVRRALASGAPRRGPGLRVLVVDDDRSGRRLLARVLADQGHAVGEAADGVEALGALKNGHYDAVVCDLMMPRMDGYRLCQEIRRTKPLKDLPIVVYSATFSSKEDLQLAKDMGADLALGKPASAEEIAQAVRVAAARPAGDGSRRVLDESAVMKEYNEALVRKLEKTASDLRALNEQLEERVRARTEALQAANRDLEAFSHSVSHDLKGPLRRVQMYAARLQGRLAAGLDAEAAGWLEGVKKESGAAGALIDSLLALSQARSAELRRSEVDLSALARAILADLREQEPGRDVEALIPPGLKARGDPALLRSVLSNLLENAWKYTAGRADARIELGHRPLPDEDVFFVRDNGVGFDPGQKDRLFKPFQRLDERFQGTGLGLATAARVIERHGGAVWCEAREGQGATFYFSLPRA